jgi:TRAP-type C4-dicarboxylate transport system permease small subunit
MTTDPGRGTRGGPLPALSRALAVACTAMGWLGAALFACVAVLMVAQASARAFGFAVIGGDEITGWMSASAAFVALAYTFREGALIRMELVLVRLDAPKRRVAELLALGVGGVWCGYMAAAMIRFVWQNAMYGERSTGLISIPIWPVQLPSAIGLSLLFLAFVDQFLRVALGERPLYVTKAESMLAGDDAHSAGI